ncbi:DUF2235 domain-containing protein [Alisedimentitalea sp. MJ-SS2]|uniref:DUF2235 domain-containing protein n=1 Tax=Aliisedimentitalea sp. MJ-SS2 TaxID=3049795 RepID=UPI0029152736|nr:DUF2235 domain-containing protein [Alisedimentitalea sp. MJ-SS2]MDU8928422.1 DUF2235 domain-containing protein [Alisedimentitalea sp. MJ-SS2]
MLRWLRPWRRDRGTVLPRGRGAMVHVIVLDGTMSTLHPGCESNAGLTYRLLTRIGAPVSVYYEAGVQWRDWRSTGDVMMGRGINRQIRRAYGYLASRYRPGDRIYLFGYSRGAFAVRSLAGVIDQVGLLRAECATERNVQTAYRHYQAEPGGDVAEAFTAAHCHGSVKIEMLGVWDTVKALGLRLPILWRWSEQAHRFHNHHLGASVRHGYHALALDETREAFAPVMWTCEENEGEGHVEQVWFPGAHSDVGGQLGGFDAARPLANLSLVWMMERAEAHGLPLPMDWRAAFPTEPTAPSVGTWMGWGKLFLIRKRRVVGADRSERLHESVAQRDVMRAEAEAAV